MTPSGDTLVETIEEGAREMFKPREISPAVRTRQYRGIFMVLFVVLVLGLLLDDILGLFPFPGLRRIFMTGHFVLAALYVLLVWKLLRGFVKSRAVIVVAFTFIVSSFAAILVMENPFYPIVGEMSWVLAAIHAVFICIEAYVMCFVLNEVFTPHNLTTNNLWGAVSLFFMFTIACAEAFDIVLLLDPMALGIYVAPGFPSFSESLYCSISSVIGSTPSFSTTTHSVRNLVALEGFIGNLYLVVLLGRIIGIVPTSAGKRGAS